MPSPPHHGPTPSLATHCTCLTSHAYPPYLLVGSTFHTFLWSLALQQRHHFRALLTRAPNLVHVHYGGGGGWSSGLPSGGSGSSGLPSGRPPPAALPLCSSIRTCAASAAPPGLCLLVIPRGGPATSPVGLSGRAPRSAVHSQCRGATPEPAAGRVAASAF